MPDRDLPPSITRIEPLAPRGRRVRIHLDVGEPFEVALEALERTRLGVGDPVSGGRREELIGQDAEVGVRDAALTLISHRARTRDELRRKLRRKGLSSALIEPCLDRLEAQGLLDDDAVAATFVRDRIRHRPRGRARLASELRAKGIEADAAQEAIDRVFEDEASSDVSLALEGAEGWLRRQGAAVRTALATDGRAPEALKARRRLLAYLGRRGFSGDAVRQGLERVLALAREGAGR